MKTPGAANPDPELNKSLHNKVNKKSTKSRSKSTKLEVGGSKTATSTLGSAVGVGSLPATPTHVHLVTTPTTPTSSHANYNMFDASFAVAGGGHGVAGVSAAEASGNTSRMSHHKSYAGFDPRSIKIFWEQHDQTDVELSQEVCARLAEDASYKVWELINNLKIYSRHSGGVVTYDLVNEVLKDADVPPMLGAMDSDWDRIDYDGSYYYHSDKIFELRDEFQKEISLSLPDDADFHSFCPVEDKHTDQLKQCVQSMVTAALFADKKTQSSALAFAFQTPLMGSIYRVIVSKMLQLLAFKQQEQLSRRCWRLLRACNYNSQANPNACRQEYFHLAEVLVSQLMAPYETIKAPPEASDNTVQMELEEPIKIKPEQFPDPGMDVCKQEPQEQPQEQAAFPTDSQQQQTIYKIKPDDDTNEVGAEPQNLSSYFASPVGNGLVDELCETIGQLASQSGYLHSECLFLIKRRLARFFEGRNVCSERDFQYISRAGRGLIALGAYAFREFIPYIYKLNADEIPDTLWQDLAPAAVFLEGRDDIYLYEWLEHGCGASKLQPFMVHYARAYEENVTRRYVRAKTPVYRIEATPGVRRLEWSTLAAAMCHGDDPSKALKPKPTLREAFPELQLPNLRHNCCGSIRFKFAGCRPMLLKVKAMPLPQAIDSPSTINGGSSGSNSDILIARRKLFKPLTNVRREVPTSGYHYIRI